MGDGGEHGWSVRCSPATGLVHPVRIDPTGVGGPTRGQARGTRWRRTGQGWYVPAEVSAACVEQRILEASMHLPEHAAVTAWGALRLHGAGYFNGLEADGRTPLPVPLQIGPRGRLRGHVGITGSRERLFVDELTQAQGIRCVTPLRAVFDEMRRTGRLRDAVQAFDMAAAAGLVDLEELRAFLESNKGWTGIGVVRDALAWVDPQSDSPAESRLRLVWCLDADLPPPLCNADVFDLRGCFVGRPDLLDVEAGVVGEYDGAEHRRADRRRHDLGRLDAFREVGLEPFTVVGGELGNRDLVVRRMLVARSRARWSPPSERGWCVRPRPPRERRWPPPRA